MSPTDTVLGRARAGTVGPDAPADARIPSLDGLRAVSILLVLLGHVGGTAGLDRLDLGIGDYAHLGVVVFFVISGFLITGLLVDELSRTGRVSLPRFYARRALRLFPAAYAYLLFVIVLGWVSGDSIGPSALWHAATYTVNYLPAPPWLVGHLWSLSVEEQFYLLWPLTFLVVPPTRLTWVAASVIALGPIARFGSWLLGPPWRDLETFPVVADSLAAGCLLATGCRWLESQRWYTAWFNPLPSCAVMAGVLLVNRYRGFSPVWVFGTSLMNLGLAFLVHRAVVRHRDVVGRALNTKLLASVGVLSYSLYLWQQPFLNRHSTTPLTAFPQNLALAALAALGSYFMLERPLFSLRRHLRL